MKAKRARRSNDSGAAAAGAASGGGGMGAMAAALCLTTLSPMGAHGVQFIPELCDCSLPCVEQAFKTTRARPESTR